MTPAVYSFVITQGANFGPQTIQHPLDSNGNTVNVTAWTPRAQARPLGDRPCGLCAGGLVIDLSPSVSNGPAGEFSLGQKTADETRNMSCGVYDWDLLGTAPNGYVVGPIAAGRIKVVCPVTQPI